MFRINDTTKWRHPSASLSVGPEGTWVCIYPDGRVPLPVLRRLLVVRFLRFGLEGLVLLLRHFHHSVLWLLQLCPLLCRALPSPTHLHTANNIWIYNKKEEVYLIYSGFHNVFPVISSPPSSWSLRFLFLHNMKHPQWATSSWAGRLHHLTPKTQIIRNPIIQFFHPPCIF